EVANVAGVEVALAVQVCGRETWDLADSEAGFAVAELRSRVTATSRITVEAGVTEVVRPRQRPLGFFQMRPVLELRLRRGERRLQLAEALLGRGQLRVQLRELPLLLARRRRDERRGVAVLDRP